MRVKLKREVVKFIEETASWVDTSTGTYYYTPLWYKKIDNKGTFEQYSFDKLPEELKTAINNLRNIPTNEK